MDRPSFLVIVSDQHNPHVAGYAGDSVVRTPHLDRLAAAAVRFDNTYCAGPLCVPSRMAFMTGQYPLDLGIWTNGGVLPSATPTFAHALAAGGYETVLCGRMHFVGPDQNHGFQRRLVGDVSGALTGMPAPGEMFEGVWSKRGCGQDYGSLLGDAVGPGRATYEIYDEAVVERAEALLAEWDRRPADRPFCLVVGLLLPHNPYVCSRALFEEYMDRLPAMAGTVDDGHEHAAVRELKQQRGAGRITPEMARRARAAYYGLVTTLDGSVGRLTRALAATRFARSTHVLYTSDHGDLCGEHGLWWKDSFYEGSVRVPLLWGCPDGGGSGAADRRVVSLCDLAVTFTDLAGAPALPAARGQSLAPALRRERQRPAGSGTAFAETCAVGQRPARMVRQGPWKLCVYHGYEQVQLFDVDHDPGETRDLGRESACAEARDALREAVTRDWDGAIVEQRLRCREAEGELLARSRAAAGPASSECWAFPLGGNRHG